MNCASAFEARYHSGCLACEGHISPGDDVKWADGEVVHADCDILDAATMRPAPAVCPRCFMVPSLTGICGCSDD